MGSRLWHWGKIMHFQGFIRRVLAGAGAVALGLALGSAAHAAAVLDQSNPPDFLGLNDSFEWQQQVTSGAAGTLAGITLYGSSSSDLVRIALGNAFNSGPFVFSQTVTLSSVGTFIDTSAAGIHLTPGQTFVIDVSAGDGCCFLRGSVNPYSGGDLFLNSGSPQDYTTAFGYSMGFQTFVSGGVPEPATWAMLLIGFGVAGAVLRRRASKPQLA